uniref:Germin-like protein n=1 Tax=Fagus sylvatica TaxID=28930 RepID=A0A2N9FUA7_FAGSY
MPMTPLPCRIFCVALNNSSDSVVFFNGKVCKDPKLATADDFYFAGLNIAGNTENIFGSNFTPVTIPGLNTLGLTVGRIDFAPNGQSPPHIHPRASETIVVLEGTLYVGFVTSNPDNRLFTKVLNKGDVFAIPIGLIHFAIQRGKNQCSCHCYSKQPKSRHKS